MSEAPTKGEKFNARQRELAKASERARKSSLTLLMGTVQGRKFVWDTLTFCNVFAQTYREGSFDGTAFLEGSRRVGNWLLTDIVSYCPGFYLQMTRENSSVTLNEESEEDE